MYTAYTTRLQLRIRAQSEGRVQFTCGLQLSQHPWRT